MEYLYFIRRAFATLWEMDYAFHKLNMLKEFKFKSRKRSFDRRRLKKWVAAVVFFSKTKKFINSQRNAYGGHITDDLARFVLSRVEQADESPGALEVTISDDRTNHYVFTFAETIVRQAMFVDCGERDHAEFLHESWGFFLTRSNTRRMRPRFSRMPTSCRHSGGAASVCLARDDS